MSAAPGSELDQRYRAFLDEYDADAQWDSEFTPSPHDPYGAMAKLAALGADAVPRLGELLSARERDLRRLACHGAEWMGPAAAPLLPALERLLADDWCSGPAATAIARIEPERFWALGLPRFTDAVRSLMDSGLARDGGAAPLLARLAALDEEAPVLEALSAVDSFITYTGKGQPLEPALLDALRRCSLSRHATVRGRAAFVLGKIPGAQPTEALVEGMATSGHLGNLETVAWHEDSVVLVRLAAEKRNVDRLAELLMRRRCAGLATDAEPLLPLVADVLRHPKREWRYEEHEVEAAARCAFELGHPALLAPLVDAVVPENGGYAWDSLVRALRSYGPDAVAALTARREQVKDAQPGVFERAGWMLDALGRAPDWLEVADGAFLRGQLEPSVGGAFRAYATALRLASSAHAAFQVAWIDRAFGAAITPARRAWIRGLGFRDEAFLDELTRPVPPLEGHRFLWTKCAAKDVARVLAAGVPGLAYLGSRDPAHLEAAKAHVERVKAATR